MKYKHEMQAWEFKHDNASSFNYSWALSDDIKSKHDMQDINLNINATHFILTRTLIRL